MQISMFHDLKFASP